VPRTQLVTILFTLNFKHAPLRWRSAAALGPTLVPGVRALTPVPGRRHRASRSMTEPPADRRKVSPIARGQVAGMIMVRANSAPGCGRASSAGKHPQASPQYTPSLQRIGVQSVRVHHVALRRPELTASQRRALQTPLRCRPGLSTTTPRGRQHRVTSARDSPGSATSVRRTRSAAAFAGQGPLPGFPIIAGCGVRVPPALSGAGSAPKQ
jgi:hypothetical protein